MLFISLVKETKWKALSINGFKEHFRVLPITT